MEHPRLGVVLTLISMLIAMANLATDITRLMLELSTPRANGEPIPIQTRRQQEPPRQGPDMGQPDTAPKGVETLGMFGARGPPRGFRDPGTPRVPFSPLPPDFSIGCPPWRLVCRRPVHRNFDRRRSYD
jgi:hypothetical protein